MSKPTIIQVIKSVLAAFIGVQSRENREKDFTEGNPTLFIFVGIAATILFVLFLIFIVSLIT